MTFPTEHKTLGGGGGNSTVPQATLPDIPSDSMLLGKPASGVSNQPLADQGSHATALTLQKAMLPQGVDATSESPTSTGGPKMGPSVFSKTRSELPGRVRSVVRKGGL